MKAGEGTEGTTKLGNLEMEGILAKGMLCVPWQDRSRSGYGHDCQDAGLGVWVRQDLEELWILTGLLRLL